ncbi:hypothetical protein D3C86_1681540 [compost metagenome]
MAAMWARSWCVRPVNGRSAIHEARCAARLMVAKAVSAGSPLGSLGSAGRIIS